jgi:DNA polymerase (family X)
MNASDDSPAPVSATATTANQEVADMLREAATLLTAQGANPFRVGAYRKAADVIAALPGNVRDVFDRSGMDGLDAIPSIGKGIASAIAEILITGRWAQLDRLRGEVDATHLLRTIPGIGPELATRIHDELGIETLEALEVAAHDGRLEKLAGVGPRRASAIRASLTQSLDRTRALRRQTPVPHATGPHEHPPVALILDVDREYREKATLHKLPTIVPRRFNPTGKVRLPILHTERGEWHFTVLFSNTAKAHELGRTHDWVVVYAYDHDAAERPHTVVTEMRGSLVGKRVVRGREVECRDFYEERPSPSSPPAPSYAA